jgi:4-hydroxybenzoate polyprenyltransferase
VTSARDWGRLVRLSLAPSAAADVAAGLVVGFGGAWPARASAWWLVPASLGVYHGALALNDWNDRAHDARTRATRPLPSGAIAPNAALALGVALIVLGLVCASLARVESAVWMSAVAACAVLYDLRGRGAWLGPLLLGLCRAGNLGSGLFYASRELSHPLSFALLLPCIAYGVYVFLVSRLGRMEDAEDGAPLARRPSVLLVAGALVIALVPFCTPHAVLGDLLPSIAVAFAGAFGLVACAARTREWTRPLVERAMGLCLRRLLVFTAAAAMAAFHGRVIVLWSDYSSTTTPAAWPALVVGIAILAGYPLAFGLRKLFPPS